MKRRKFILSLAGTTAIGLTGLKIASSKAQQSSGEARTQLAKIERSTWALGTQVNLTVYHQDAKTADQAITAAFAKLQEVEKLLSIYRPDSELSFLNRNKQLANPHPYLVEILEYARDLSQQTDGAFDITVQPLWKLYYNQNKGSKSPSESEIHAALAQVDWKQVDITSNLLRLKGADTEITLNGIAQGYACDRVKQVLADHGIQHALIDTGEIGSIGTPSGRDAWNIGIKHPRHKDQFKAMAQVKDRCLATSGDYETLFSEDYRNHHLLDPHTGHSPEALASVTIAAPNGLQADALSTAVFILGPEQGRQLVEATPDCDALFISKSGNLTKTAGFPTLS